MWNSRDLTITSVYVLRLYTGERIWENPWRNAKKDIALGAELKVWDVFYLGKMYLYIAEIVKFKTGEQQNQFLDQKNGRKQFSGRRLGTMANLNETLS